MKKIKVIELLNMLANEEYDKLPEIISFMFQKYYLATQVIKADGVEVAKKCTYKNDRGNEILERINYVGRLCDEIIIIGQPILDEKEKEYLSAVIRPFRDKVKGIIKYDDPTTTQEWIVIKTTGGSIIFPYFEKNTMYKGIELGRKYTLEELGL